MLMLITPSDFLNHFFIQNPERQNLYYGYDITAYFSSFGCLRTGKLTKCLFPGRALDQIPSYSLMMAFVIRSSGFNPMYLEIAASTPFSAINF